MHLLQKKTKSKNINQSPLLFWRGRLARKCVSNGRCPSGISPASHGLAFQCSGSSLPPSHGATLPQINILYDSSIVWACDKACQRGNEALSCISIPPLSLRLSPMLSICPSAATLNQFVSIPNNQRGCWDLNCINKWMSKQTSARPAPPL